MSAQGTVRIGDPAVHLAYRQELADLLANAQISDDQRARFLNHAACPCCGAPGDSLNLDLTPNSRPWA